MTKAEWKTLDSQLRFRAFTVARLNQFQAIEDVKQKLIQAIDSGASLGQFLKDAEFRNIAGVGNGGSAYWETVYRTNVQGAYNAGRAQQIAQLQPGYLEFIGLEDERQTDICRDRSNTVLPASAAWWASNWPPLHFGCRSTVRSVPDAEAKARGLTEAATLDGFPTAGRGFGENPIATGSFWKMTPDMVLRAQQFGITKQVQSFARDQGLGDFRLSKTAYTSADDGQKVTKGLVFDVPVEGGDPIRQKVLSIKPDFLGNQTYVTDYGLAHTPGRMEAWGGESAYYSLYDRAVTKPDIVLWDREQGAFLYGLKDTSKAKAYLWFVVGADTGRVFTVIEKAQPFTKIGSRYILEKGTL
jgi:SPP1 gp7 family putative phage head morphogenesis protein